MTTDEMKKRIDEALRRGLAGIVARTPEQNAEAMRKLVARVRARLIAEALGLEAGQVELLAHEIRNALAPTVLVLAGLRDFAAQTGSTEIGQVDLETASAGVERVIELVDALVEEVQRPTSVFVPIVVLGPEVDVGREVADALRAEEVRRTNARGARPEGAASDVDLSCAGAPLRRVRTMCPTCGVPTVGFLDSTQPDDPELVPREHRYCEAHRG